MTKGPSVKPTPLEPCSVPDCPDPTGGYVMPGSKRPQRRSLARYDLPGVACHACCARVRTGWLREHPEPAPRRPDDDRRGTVELIGSLATAAIARRVADRRKEADARLRQCRRTPVPLRRLARKAIVEYREAWRSVRTPAAGPE